jgi:hypothetical protein
MPETHRRAFNLVAQEKRGEMLEPRQIQPVSIAISGRTRISLTAS